MQDPDTEETPSTEGERHRREENTQAIGGAIGGMTGGGVVGGLAMGALGPLGAVLGILAGYAGGWWAGEEIVERTEELDDVDGRLRSLHETVGGERPWKETRHAYQLGYLAGRSPHWGDGGFESVEADLRAAWVEAHEDIENPPGWDEVRDRVRGGWEVGRERT